MSYLREYVRQNRLMTFLALLVLVLGLAVVWSLVRPNTDSQIEQLRKQGYPVTLAELNAYYAEVPADQNLALACERVFQTMAVNQGLDQWLANTNTPPARHKPLSPDIRTYLESVLARHQPSLELLHSLPSSNRSRYSLDLTQGTATLLPHLATLKESVALLVMEAMVLGDDGEIDQAIESLAIAGRVADSLAQEPILISYLVRAATWKRILAGLEQLLNATSLTEPQLASLQTLVEQAEKTQNPLRALAGERAFGLSLFMDRRQQAQLFGNAGPNASGGAWIPNLAFTALRASGLLQRDRTFYMKNLGASIDAAQQPFPSRFRQAKTIDTSPLTNRFYIISRMMLPALGNTFSKDAENVARFRAAIAALAVQRYRLAHGGALPETLQDLVPAFVPVLPTDPIDGASLRFKRLPTGFLVYSIGADGKDDTETGQRPIKPNAPATDILFEVHR